MGYGIIAKRLFDDPQTVRGKDNPYFKWIRNYVEDDYRAAVEAGSGAYPLTRERCVRLRLTKGVG